MSDRNNNYVPEPFHHQDGELRQVGKALLGGSGDRDIMTQHELVYAMPDGYNRQVRGEYWAKISDNPDHYSLFRGHKILVEVNIKTWNEREVNEWKGRDEIRPSGGWEILFNGRPVASDYILTKNIDYVMRHIKDTIDKLKAFTRVDWSEDPRPQIEGQKVYYKDVPAVIKRWLSDGHIIVKAIDGFKFPKMAYDIDNMTGTDENPEHDWSEEFAHEVKVRVYDENIYWGRKREEF